MQLPRLPPERDDALRILALAGWMRSKGYEPKTGATLYLPTSQWQDWMPEPMVIHAPYLTEPLLLHAPGRS